MSCPLCGAVENVDGLRFYDGKLCAAVVILNPISEFHCLVIPKRHVIKLSELNPEELKEMFDVLAQLSSFIEAKYDGSALIAMNRKRISTVPHLHFHVLNSNTGGIRAFVAALKGCEVYPADSPEKLAVLVEEYKEFVSTELVD